MNAEKDSKGNQIYTIQIDPEYKDPIVRCKVIFNCTSYCLDMQYGPNTTMLLTFEQWLDNKMISTDARQISVVSNIRKRILPKKRLRLDSDDEAE